MRSWLSKPGRPVASRSNVRRSEIATAGNDRGHCDRDARPVTHCAGLIGNLFEKPLEEEFDGLPLAVEPRSGRRHVRGELADADAEDGVAGAEFTLHLADAVDRGVERCGAHELVRRC